MFVAKQHSASFTLHLQILAKCCTSVNIILIGVVNYNVECIVPQHLDTDLNLANTS